MSANGKIPTTELAKRPWEIGDPIEVSLEERLRVILMKVVAERNQYEATATELDHLVNIYRTNYEKAAAEIKRLRDLLAVYEVPEKKPLTVTKLARLKPVVEPE